jgi:hypothetical protein
MMCPVVRISTPYRMLTEWFSTSRLVFKNVLNWIVPYKAVPEERTRADAYSSQGGECERQICSTPKTEHVKSRRLGVRGPVVVRSMPRSASRECGVGTPMFESPLSLTGTLTVMLHIQVIAIAIA